MSRNLLKYIAIICMTLDHIAWYFIPFTEPSAQIMHFFGRMTAPIMCFFIAEGFHYTRNIKSYVTRLTVFAIISEIPYFILNRELNMIFTLLLGLLSLITIKSEIPKAAKIVVLLVIFGISFYSDWLCFGVLWIVFFYIFRNKKSLSIVSFLAVWFVYFVYAYYNSLSISSGVGETLLNTVYATGSLVSLVLIEFFYDSKKGSITKSKSNLEEGEPLPKHYHLKRFFNKWIFYVYYPLHLSIIVIVKFLTEVK